MLNHSNISYIISHYAIIIKTLGKCDVYRQIFFYNFGACCVYDSWGDISYQIDEPTT